MSSVFPKISRLRKSWEYQLLNKVGCKFHTPHFILLLKNNSLGISRLGITVSKRIGNAVERNYVKRHLREFFRLYRHTFVDTFDICIIAKRGSASLSRCDIYREIKRVLMAKGYFND